MTDRIQFGNNGSQFVARVARPTKTVSSTDLADYALHEGFSTLVPIARGTVTLGVGATTSLSLPEIVGRTPFVVLKSDEGILPVSPFLGARGTFYMAVIPTTGACTLYNQYSTSLTITYAVFIAP